MGPPQMTGEGRSIVESLKVMAGLLQLRGDLSTIGHRPNRVVLPEKLNLRARPFLCREQRRLLDVDDGPRYPGFTVEHGELAGVAPGKQSLRAASHSGSRERSTISSPRQITL